MISYDGGAIFEMAGGSSCWLPGKSDASDN